MRLSLGNVGWCAEAPAKLAGSPPSSAKTDKVDKFTGQPRTPAPASCPAPKGSPSGAFLDDPGSGAVD